MRVTAVTARILTVPVAKGRSLPRAEDPGPPPPETLQVLHLSVGVEGGPHGTGFVFLPTSSRATLALLDDVFGPQIVGGDPRLTERHYSQAKQVCPEITLGGIEARAYAAVDIALWDVKAQAAGLPLYQLLGGVRDAAPCHVAETLWPGLSSDRVKEIAQPMLDAGIGGLRVGIGRNDPVRDAGKLQHLREEIGDHVWFGVHGHQGLDLNTALAFGRFLEEELDADLYDDPVPSSDLDAYARLSHELELPLGAGSTLGSAAFTDLVTRTRVSVLQPNLGRVGGITPTLKIIALAESHHRTVMPQGYTEIAAHLACAFPAVASVDYVRWLAPVIRGGPTLSAGELRPSTQNGLGVQFV